MDVKVGTRTFLEAEVRNTKRRPDLAEKMAKQGGALTEEERAGGITKLRYMQFREQSSSSATLGWRIEAIARPRAAGDGAAAAAAAAAEKLDTKKLRERAEIVAAIRTFVAAAPAQRRAPLAAAMRRRLEALRSALEASPFFRAHEVVGSSLLFVHDAADDRADVAAVDEGAGIWMIDFARPHRSLRRSWPRGRTRTARRGRWATRRTAICVASTASSTFGRGYKKFMV